MTDHDLTGVHRAVGKNEQGMAETTYDLDEDPDLQQIEKRDYDPTYDKRDMRRLGKKQELKVSSVASSLGGQSPATDKPSAASELSPLVATSSF